MRIESGDIVRIIAPYPDGVSGNGSYVFNEVGIVTENDGNIHFSVRLKDKTEFIFGRDQITLAKDYEVREALRNLMS